MDGLGGEEVAELSEDGGKEGDEEGEGEKVAVEEIFVPVAAVGGVGELGVETHDRGEDLG